jgi:hypothetical protein
MEVKEETMVSKYMFLGSLLSLEKAEILVGGVDRPDREKRT